jgi:hypothetical protein
MAAFQRQQRRFTCHGLSLTHALDALPEGKYGVLQNVRSYVDDTLTARAGLALQATGPLTAPIHSIQRFDDPTPFATVAHRYFLGGGGNLYAGTVGSGVSPQIDTGYSGNPLSFVTATPPQSPQPWLYIADTARIRKTNANLATTYAVGLLPPTGEPSLSLQALGFQVIDDFSGAFVPWMSVGASVTALGASIHRTNTTIAAILYDSGGTGYCSIVPTLWDNINDLELVTLNGVETVPITETTVAVATTTIAAILYDAGNTGLCTIQPTASLGVGQLEGPAYDDYRARYLRGLKISSDFASADNDRVRQLQSDAYSRDLTQGIFAEPTGAGATPRIRQVDFPVNCIVTLGAERVRILAVAVGPDGVQSFRCSTAGAHVAGEAIVGAAAFRCATVGAYAAGQTIQDDALYNIITPVLQPDGTYANIAGVRTGAGWAARNLAQVNGRATLPDDDVHLSLRFNYPTEVQTVRVYFSTYATAGTVPSAADFINEYFFFEWRQSDIAAAIQQTNTAQVSSVQDVRFTAIGNLTVNQDIQGSSPLTDQPGGGLTGQTTSSVIKLGNDQWLELRCKVRDLQQIGTDPSKTLANVTAAEILVNVAAPDVASALDVQVSYDALWISGGYGPDVSAVATPYVLAYRYRSSHTGAKSNPSPPTRGGVIPRRQRVIGTGTPSADPQVDLADWFALGATLNRWTYVGTVPNAGALTFNYDWADSAVSGGDTLTYDSFPPWPTQDLPRSGTCNVAGSRVQWVSGDAFNTNWAPGSLLIINGQTYSLYAQPTSTTALSINENAGSGGGLAFTVIGATLLGQIMSSVCGGVIAGATFLFACGDAINPGQVHWTHGNNPEEASDKDTLDLTPATDPLQAVFFWDAFPCAASTETIIVLEPTFGQATPFTPRQTAVSRGFWTRNAWCETSYGIAYLAKDGIALWAGGVERMITDEDLYPLFPHDGQPGMQVNEVLPPDMAGNILRLSFNDGWLYFDYRSADGIGHTLAYRFAEKSWWYDTYNKAVSCRESAVAAQVHQMLIGTGTGEVWLPGGTTDGGVAIACRVQFTENQGDARRQKVYRDLMLDAQNADPITVTLGVNNNGTLLPAVALAGAGAGRVQSLIDATLETGVFGTNLTATLAWNAGVTPTLLYAWDEAFQPAPELATSWLSGPTTHGFRGFQEVYQLLLAYLSNGPATLSLIVDGVAYTYSVPTTAGKYAKIPIILQAKKGMTFQYGLASAGGVMVFDADCESWVSVWGQGDGYAIIRPF